MAFETGTATDRQDLLTKLSAFLTSTSPQAFFIDRAVGAASPIDFAFNDGDDLYVQILSISSDLYVHQSTGFDGSGVPNEPGQATDSVLGARVDTMTGPYTAYSFYANLDATIGPVYCHVVVEYTSGRYRHFGFGNLDKVGTYTGGQYTYGTYWVSVSDPNSGSNFVAFDGLGTTGHNYKGRLYLPIDSIPGYNGVVESPAQKFATFGTGSTFGTDKDGAQFVGALVAGSRQGWYLQPFYEIGGSSLYNGFKPMPQIPIILQDLDPAPDEYYLLGYAPDVRNVSMDGVIPGQSVVVGGDTWDFYPMIRKQVATDGVEKSGLLGYAYKRLV